MNGPPGNPEAGAKAARAYVGGEEWRDPQSLEFSDDGPRGRGVQAKPAPKPVEACRQMLGKFHASGSPLLVFWSQLSSSAAPRWSTCDMPFVDLLLHCGK